jgi:hypothetical protein
LDLERWAFSFIQAMIDQEHEQEQDRSKSKSKKKEPDFVCKKLPPPTPDGREGRLFPPEQS